MDSREIWERLISTVMTDTVLSDDEHKLLKNVLNDLETYEQTLSKAMDDGIIDNNEKANLFQLRIQIIKRMYDIANTDDKITEEETSLIRTTQRIINELAEIERQTPKEF